MSLPELTDEEKRRALVNAAFDKAHPWKAKIFGAPGFYAFALSIGAIPFVSECVDRTRRRTPPAFESATLEQCAQAEAACLAVGQKLGITVTIPPWQAMVLAPVLDPR